MFTLNKILCGYLLNELTYLPNRDKRGASFKKMLKMVLYFPSTTLTSYVNIN